MSLGAVQLGVEVAAAGEDHAVERVERLLEPVVGGGTTSGPTTRLLDRANVGQGHERGLLGPHAPADLLRIGRDPDQRSHPRSNIRSRS